MEEAKVEVGKNVKKVRFVNNNIYVKSSSDLQADILLSETIKEVIGRAGYTAIAINAKGNQSRFEKCYK